MWDSKFLNMGLIFYKNIPKYGSVMIQVKFLVYPCENLKIVKNGPIFPEKSLKMGTFFCKNDLKNGLEF